VALGLARVPGAPLWGALGAVLIACAPPFRLFGALTQNPFSAEARAQNFQTFFAADFRTLFRWEVFKVLGPVAFAFFMTDFFDTMGTALGVGRQAGFVDEKGMIPRIRALLCVDSLGALLGGLFGCSSVTSYIESAAGVAVGGRTGLANIVTGLAFWASLFFLPLIAIVGGGIPVGENAYAYPATAPALIVVGFLMIAEARRIDFSSIETGLPAFLTIVSLPLTFSISHGIALGFISHCLIQIVRGRWRETHPFLYASAALFVAMFFIA